MNVVMPQGRCQGGGEGENGVRLVVPVPPLPRLHPHGGVEPPDGGGANASLK